MRDGARFFEFVQARVDMLARKIVPVSEPISERSTAVGVTIEFRPIARRDDHRFVHGRNLPELLQRLGQFLRRKYHFFADFHRRSTMVDAEYNEGHGVTDRRFESIRLGRALKRCGRAGPTESTVWR